MATGNLYQAAQSAATQGAQDMDAIFGEVADINNERASALSSAAKDKELVTLTEGLAIAKQQKQALDFATKLGTNPEANTEVLSTLIRDKNNLFQTARDNLRKISATRNTSLFTNPGAWLAGNLNLEKDTNNYNAAAEEYNLVGKRIDDVVSSTDDLVKMTKGIQVSVTDASAEAAARLAAAQLNDAAAGARIDALKSNAEGIVKVQGLKQTALSNAVQQQQLGMEAQRLALAKESAAQQRAQMALAINDKNEQLEEKTRTIQAVNLYRKTNGMPEISWTDLKLLYKDPEQKRIMDQQITGGLTIAQSGGRYLADNPSNAMLIASSNGAQLPAGPASLVSTANSVLASVKQDIQAGKVKEIKNPQQLMEAVNARMTQRAADEQKQISEKNSMYVPPTLATLLSDPAIKETPSAKLVLAALATSGVKTFDAAQAVPLIFESVKKGEMTMDRAIADITFIASKSVAYNNAHFSYDTTMGLPLMKGYNARLPQESFAGTVGSLIGKSLANIFNVSTPTSDNVYVGGQAPAAILDLTNPAKVQDYANRYMAGNISATLKQQAAKNSSKTTTR